MSVRAGISLAEKEKERRRKKKKLKILKKTREGKIVVGFEST